MADEREVRTYWDIGGKAAMNSVSACDECGAVVYSQRVHDDWHAAFTTPQVEADLPHSPEEPK